MKVCQDCVFSMFSVLILLNPLNMFSMFSSPGALNLLNIPFIGAEVFAVVCICENSGRPDPILTLDNFIAIDIAIIYLVDYKKLDNTPNSFNNLYYLRVILIYLFFLSPL